MVSERLPYVVASVAVGLLVVAAWAGRGRATPVAAGFPAPDITVRTLSGDPVSLSDFRGRVVLLNIWATWCVPCRAEMPSMETLYRSFRGRDFEILAVSVDRALGDDHAAVADALEAFAGEYDLTFPILHDREGRIESLYGTTGVPESYVIGRDGVIVRHLAGATIWDHTRYRELIQRLLDT